MDSAQPAAVPSTPAGAAAAGDLARALAGARSRIQAEVGKLVVGLQEEVDLFLCALVARGHILFEGVPGVAKTLLAKSVATAVGCDFRRIQFTPDLLPGDITGTFIFDRNKSEFLFRRGPIFTQILLADEINRAPAKTQSALLEAMQERQVTIEGNTSTLSDPFMVIATQNPIEQEGVYRLPEAQQDRFMYKVLVPRPSQSELKEIMRRFSKKDGQPKAGKVTSLPEMVEIRKVAEQIYVDESIEDYITALVEATHNPTKYGIDAKDAIEGGASPRAAIFLLKAAKINALLEGRAFVDPSDVRAVANRILRHRLTLSYSAQNLTTDMVVDSILKKVPMPRPRVRATATLTPSDRKP